MKQIAVFVVAILPMVLLGVNGPSPQGFAGFAWPMSWLASTVVISFGVPWRIWNREYRTHPPDEYHYGFENPWSYIIWGFGTSWASGVALSILGNVNPIPQATLWMLAYLLFVLAMVGVARFWIFLNPVPLKCEPPRPDPKPSSGNWDWSAWDMASQTPDLDSVDQRLRRIERSIGTGNRGSINERLERIERSIG